MKKLGATHYIDSRSQNAVEELVKMGGAKVILATVPSGKAMSTILGGLGVNGKLMMIGASDEPVEVPSLVYHFIRLHLIITRVSNYRTRRNKIISLHKIQNGIKVQGGSKTIS